VDGRCRRLRSFHVIGDVDGKRRFTRWENALLIAAVVACDRGLPAGHGVHGHHVRRLGLFWLACSCFHRLPDGAIVVDRGSSWRTRRKSRHMLRSSLHALNGGKVI